MFNTKFTINKCEKLDLTLILSIGQQILTKVHIPVFLLGYWLAIYIREYCVVDIVMSIVMETFSSKVGA